MFCIRNAQKTCKCGHFVLFYNNKYCGFYLVMNDKFLRVQQTVHFSNPITVILYMLMKVHNYPKKTKHCICIYKYIIPSVQGTSSFHNKFSINFCHFLKICFLVFIYVDFNLNVYQASDSFLDIIM